MPAATSVENWLYPTPHGLYCAAGDFHVDPSRPVDRAILTHGHSDHARPGHGAVLATPETVEVVKLRLGEAAFGRLETLPLGERRAIGAATVSLHPAGHILGSAQILIEHRGMRAVVSGDYKRRRDPTTPPFEPIRCDVFITEATFGMPVFRHEPDHREIAKLLASLSAFPERAHVVGVYGLGKCQRLIRLLREAGYERPIQVHAALASCCALYERLGIALGPLSPVPEGSGVLAGEIVLAPPSALADRWSRRLAEPVRAFASGWMRVRARARQRGVELPLVISDHADWPELIATIQDVGAEEIWVTHGHEQALVHQIALMGRRGRALALVGREEEGE